MPQFPNEYSEKTSPTGADKALIADSEAGNAIKPLSLTNLKNWLASLTNWVVAAMIPDGEITTAKIDDEAVTADKIDFSTVGIARGFITGTQMGTTGNIVVTGLGFKPREVQFFAGADATDSAASSSVRAYFVNGYMIDNGSGGVHSFNVSMTASTTFAARHHSSAAFVRLNASAATVGQRLVAVSLDNDGFTVNCDTADSGNGVWWIARQ